MTTVCFVRHGETNWNAERRIQGREDIPLNQKGRKQAEACGLFLRKKQWDQIIASPLQRARETASIIAEQVGLNNIHIMKAFIERDFGQASGLTREEMKARFANQSIQNVESEEDVSDRVLQGLDSVHQRYSEQRVIIVAHGGAINACLSKLTAGKIGTGKTILHNGCVSHLHYDQQWKVIEYNCVDHLFHVK